MKILSTAEWELNKVERSYAPVASEMFWLPESTGPAVRGSLAIFALFLELYDEFAVYSLDLLFLFTILFLRSLIAETVFEIKSVSFRAPDATASCLTVYMYTYYFIKFLSVNLGRQKIGM